MFTKTNLTLFAVAFGTIVLINNFEPLQNVLGGKAT